MWQLLITAEEVGARDNDLDDSASTSEFITLKTAPYIEGSEQGSSNVAHLPSESLGMDVTGLKIAPAPHLGMCQSRFTSSFIFP